MNIPRLPDLRTQTACIHGLVLAYLSRLCLAASRRDEQGLAACPEDLAPFITAAADLVRGLILALAYSKLRHAGLTEAAEAMRSTNQNMGQALPVELFQSLGQCMPGDQENGALDDITDIHVQLQRVLSDFENAEALSDFIACLWGFWLAPNALAAGEGLGPARPHASLLVQSRRRHAVHLPFGSRHSGADPPAGPNSAFRYSGLLPPPWPPPFVARPFLRAH